MHCKINKLIVYMTYIYLIIVLWGALVTRREGTSDKVYLLSVAYLLVMGIYILIERKFRISTSFVSYIPIIMICVWAYGFMRGFYLGNPRGMIIRNFAGMSLYVLYFFLYHIPMDLDKIIKLVRVLSVFVCIVTIFMYIDTFVLHTKIFYNFPMLKNFDEAHTIEYYCRDMIYISFCCTLYKILYLGKVKVVNFVYLALCILAVFGCMRLRGVELALIVTCGIVVIFAVLKKKTPIARIFLLICAIFGIAILIYSPKIIGILFGNGDIGNKVRYRQISFFLENMTILGHGLGAPLNDLRKSNFDGYGVELIYLNIFHKFGVFAFLILFCYAYTVVQGIKMIRRTKGDVRDVIPLACMGYLIPALGNPILFGPHNILLHIVALLMIQRRKINAKIDRDIKRCL